MAEIVKMPKLSDTMTEGVVAEWHKKVGDKVKSGELLAEIETDKATMEFESYQDGVLLHIGVPKGGSAPVDSILAILGKEGEDISALLASGNQVSVASTENKSVSQPIPASEMQSRENKPDTAMASGVGVNKESGVLENGRAKSSPLARRLAQEKGLDIAVISGSGEGGRVVRRDVESFAASVPAKGQSPSGRESFREEAVSQMRKTIARRLAESKFSAPHFYLTMEIDMDEAIRARKGINEYTQNKISFNDFVIKACAIALKQHPKVNSSWLGDRIRYNDHVHIGVAVAVEEGLLVPVIRFTDEKNLARINAEVKDFAEKARAKKLQPQDWEGNTFTISNLGMFGIEEFTAIINPPDACILAVGGIAEVPVVKNGMVVPGNRMKVTLSCDHRVVDGATGAAFLNTLKQLLENPVRMLA